MIKNPPIAIRLTAAGSGMTISVYYFLSPLSYALNSKTLLKIALRFSPFLFCVIISLLGLPPASLSAVPEHAEMSIDELYIQAHNLLENPSQCDDKSELAKLFREASNRGHVLATVHLASLYLCGTGVERSARTAWGLYRRAFVLWARHTLFMPVALIILVIVPLHGIAS